MTSFFSASKYYVCERERAWELESARQPKPQLSVCNGDIMTDHSPLSPLWPWLTTFHSKCVAISPILSNTISYISLILFPCSFTFTFYIKCVPAHSIINALCWIGLDRKYVILSALQVLVLLPLYVLALPHYSLSNWISLPFPLPNPSHFFQARLHMVGRTSLLLSAQYRRERHPRRYKRFTLHHLVSCFFPTIFFFFLFNWATEILKV